MISIVRRMRVLGRRLHRVAAGVGGGMVLLAAPSLAAQGPVDVIRTRNDAVMKILDQAGDSVSGATKERLKDVLNSFIDFDELSRRALGKHWEARTDAERKDFVAVFRQLIRNSSVRKLEVYQADRVDYQAPVETPDGAVVTTVAHKGAKSVTIAYHMHRVGSAWKAFDVVIDGASTVRTYRDSFTKEIAKTSYAAMYDKLVKRAKES